MSDPEKILVIKLGALGDFVQALGPMAAIRAHHPDADITLLTTEPYVSFGTACGYFNHVWTDTRPRFHNPAGWLSLRKRLNDAKFDRVYDLQNSDRTGLYFKLLRPKPEWVGIAKGASHRNISPERTAGPAFDGHIQTLGLAGIRNITIDKMDWVQNDIARFKLRPPYVLLVPGSAPGRPEKRWPAHYFGILARTLYGWGYTPVVIGTLAEAKEAEQICAMTPQAVNLTRQTALFDIVGLARHAAAAIGNDTGPMHLIAPTGCPSYVLFSKYSTPSRHAPCGDKVQTISHQDELEKLSPEEVIEYLHVRDFRAPNQDSGDSGV